MKIVYMTSPKEREIQTKKFLQWVEKIPGSETLTCTLISGLNDTTDGVPEADIIFVNEGLLDDDFLRKSYPDGRIYRGGKFIAEPGDESEGYVSLDVQYYINTMIWRKFY